MKKTLILVLMLVFVAGVTGTVMADITGSAHDLRGDYGITTGEICLPCHSPHLDNAAVLETDSILWNHDRSANEGSYNMYSSSTLQGVGTTIDGHSKLCLSCHDGTVGVNSFPEETGAAQMLTGQWVKAQGAGGDDLSGQHPVSITYDTADNGLADPLAASLGSGSLAEVLPGNKIQCSTCHDVHNGTTATIPSETDPAGTYLLRKGNAASALCLVCHIK